MLRGLSVVVIHVIGPSLAKMAGLVVSLHVFFHLQGESLGLLTW